jgi:hypothetical protein
MVDVAAKYVAIVLCISPPEAAMCDHSYLIDNHEVSQQECSEAASIMMRGLNTPGIAVVCIRVK